MDMDKKVHSLKESIRWAVKLKKSVDVHKVRASTTNRHIAMGS